MDGSDNRATNVNSLDCIPYVKLETSKGILKFLIDTGANKSYIHPKHVNFDRCKKTDPATARNIMGIFNIDRFVEFSPFPQSAYSTKIPFYVFKFHDYFDGLIGYENIQLLGANIFSRDNVLELPDVRIQMFKRFPNVKNIQLNAFETEMIEIDTAQPDGDILVEQDIELGPSVFLHAGIYDSKNSKSFVCVTNENPEKSTVTLPVLNLEVNNFEVKSFPDDEHQDRFNIFDKLRTDHLNTEEKKQLYDLISRHPKSFYSEGETLSFTNAVKHRIETVDEIPIHTKSYRYPFCHKEEVQRQIQDMLNQGIIRHSNSPWSSPIWVVPKKKDASGKQKWRLVVDYRKLNDKTIADRYPIPNITEVLDKLGKCQYFTTLDLASGFHQIEVEERDIQKTAFSVEYGHYEYVRMPFGLKNAPATFQRVMDNVLRNLLGKNCLVYMDDIICYSVSLQEHMASLGKIFEELRKYNLKIQLDKSEFLCREVAFLGHIVTPEGVKPNPDKINVILNWPLPKTDKELRGFLGTMGYYRRFIKDFAKIVKPLTSQLKKDMVITHTKEFVETFELCKTILTSSHVLQYPDFEKPFVLTTDASDFAIGAVLSQGQIGKDRPIAFASRTLNKSEINYSVIEKELLAIVWACKYFRPYLFGKTFTLYTDHKPLTYAFGLKDPNSKMIRWRLYLAEYDYQIVFREGRQNVVADGLSRINHEVNANSMEVEVSVQDQESSTSSTNETVHSADTDDSEFIPMTESSVNSFSNQIILKIGTDEDIEVEQVFPKIHRHKITRPTYEESFLLEIFKDRMDCNRINCIFCPESLIPSIQEVYKKYFSRNKSLKIRISQTMLQDLKTLEEQNEMIEDTHLRAHRGIEENLAVISKDFYFPCMKRRIGNFVRLCKICNKEKYDRKPYKIKFAETPIPKCPMDIIHMDIFIAKPTMFLSVVDKLSRYAMLIPIKSRTIIDVRKALIDFMSIFGTPKLIVCDNEPAFKSIEVRMMLEDMGAEMYFISANHSETNGIVERFHSTLSEIYRCIRDKHEDLGQANVFKLALGLYNKTIHSAHKMKPFEVFFGVKDGEERPLDLDRMITHRNNNFEEVINQLITTQKKDLAYHNEGREEDPKLREDQEVGVRVQGIKRKTQAPFKNVIVSKDNRKTFIDARNSKLHKANLKRLP